MGQMDLRGGIKGDSEIRREMLLELIRRRRKELEKCIANPGLKKIFMNEKNFGIFSGRLVLSTKKGKQSLLLFFAMYFVYAIVPLQISMPVMSVMPNVTSACAVFFLIDSAFLSLFLIVGFTAPYEKQYLKLKNYTGYYMLTLLLVFMIIVFLNVFYMLAASFVSFMNQYFLLIYETRIYVRLPWHLNGFLVYIFVLVLFWLFYRISYAFPILTICDKMNVRRALHYSWIITGKYGKCYMEFLKMVLVISFVVYVQHFVLPDMLTFSSLKVFVWVSISLLLNTLLFIVLSSYTLISIEHLRKFVEEKSRFIAASS